MSYRRFFYKGDTVRLGSSRELATVIKTFERISPQNKVEIEQYRVEISFGENTRLQLAGKAIEKLSLVSESTWYEDLRAARGGSNGN